jgi:DNA polymerase III subunit delta
VPPRGRPTERRSIHLVAGGKGFDSYLAERQVEGILTKALAETPDTAVEQLRGEDETWARICDSARTGSLFAANRAIVVRRAETLKGDGGEMVAYAGSPNPAVTLVLVASAIDRRRSVWKKLADASEVSSAEPLKGARLAAFVREELRRRGLSIDEEGTEELIDRMGQDLRRLAGELDKLEAFGGERRSLSAVDVAAVLGRGLAPPLYLLADAFAVREARRALELTERLLDEGEDALRILATLYRSLRQVRCALGLREARVPWDGMAERLGLPPNMAFKVQSIVGASKKWSAHGLRRATAILGEWDRRLKRGANPRVALTAAIVGSCAASPAAGGR